MEVENNLGQVEAEALRRERVVQEVRDRIHSMTSAGRAESRVAVAPERDQGALRQRTEAVESLMQVDPVEQRAAGDTRSSAPAVLLADAQGRLRRDQEAGRSTEEAERYLSIRSRVV